MRNILFNNYSKVIQLLLSLIIFLVSLYYKMPILAICMYIVLYFGITYYYFIQQDNVSLNIETVFIGIFSLMIGICPIAFLLVNGSTIFINRDLFYQLPLILGSYSSMIIGITVFDKTLIKHDNTSENYFALRFLGIIFLIFSTVVNFIHIYVNREYFFGGNLESGRIQAISGNGVMVLLGSLIFVSTIIFYYCYFNQKTNKVNKYLFICSLVLLIIFSILKGARTPIINTILFIVLLKSSSKQINYKKIFKICIVLLLLLSVLQVFRYSLSSKKSSVVAETSAILVNGTVNLDYVYKTFPSKINFQHGKTYLINVKMLLPGKNQDFTLWLKEKVGLKFAGGGLTPTIIGESFLNFGNLGIPVIMFIVGLLGSFLNSKYIADNDKFWTIYISIYVVDIFRGGISNIEINIISVFLIYMCYRIIIRTKKVVNEK